MPRVKEESYNLRGPRKSLTNVYSKYFLRKDLSIKEVENITSEFFGFKYL